MPNNSYSSTKLGPAGRARELIALYRMKRRHMPGQVGRTLARLKEADREVQQLGGMVRNGKVLVIGPGQHLSELRYWTRQGNHVVGIDLDPYPSRPSIPDYVRMLRRDGLVRAVKTVGRRLAGIDDAYQRELRRQLSWDHPGKFELLGMDAGNMSFDDESFDLVFSRSVFEHLAEPKQAITEIARVLRPGGVAYVELHLYTAEGGCHDARIFAGNREGLPYWSHLRAAYRDRVRPNSYLNEIRLDEWRRLFEEGWPGVEIELRPTQKPKFVTALEEIRAGGELEDYTDEELLTVAVVARWRRPERA